MRYCGILFSITLLLFPGLSVAGIATFDDCSLDPNSHWVDEAGNSGGSFTSNDFSFNHQYTDYGGGVFGWAGFSYSNKTDTMSTGLDGQFNAITGSGIVSNNYAVAYYSSFTPFIPTITLPGQQAVEGVYVTNNNYAYYSMKNGDDFAKKFEEGDWFKLTITGKDANGDSTGSVETMLAQGTDILDSWRWVDLASLGSVKTIEFTLSSSDVGDWGMNTPAYFCIDSFNSKSSRPGDYDGDGKITLIDVIALLQVLTGIR
jgi:hypothetical protein